MDENNSKLKNFTMGTFSDSSVFHLLGTENHRKKSDISLLFKLTFVFHQRKLFPLLGCVLFFGSLFIIISFIRNGNFKQFD
jgi:hypothetical protein